MAPAFRCYVYGRGRAWHAICVDLDIAVDAASPPEAERSLATAIEMYLETVSSLPGGERRRLLARRAPWPVRFALLVWAWFHSLRRQCERPRGFLFQPHMPAHS